MPIYEYRCERCDTEFEEIVASSDENPVCPACGCSDTRKLMSCCCHGGGGSDGESGAGYSGGGGGGCAGCSGGNCASCH